MSLVQVAIPGQCKRVASATYDWLAITVVKMSECKRVVGTNVIFHYKTQGNL